MSKPKHLTQSELDSAFKKLCANGGRVERGAHSIPGVPPLLFESEKAEKKFRFLMGLPEHESTKTPVDPATE